MALQQAETLYNFMNAEDYINTVRPAVALGPKSHYNFMDGYSASSGNTESSIYSTHFHLQRRGKAYQLDTNPCQIH